MTYRVIITDAALTEAATARARALVEVTAKVGGMDLTDREREVVMLGVRMGVASCVATIRAASIE